MYPSHYRNLTNPYELERKGLFAQVYIDVNEDTRITLGARWNESEKRVADAQQFLNSIILAGGTSVGDPVTAAIQRTDPNLGLVFAGLAPPALQPIPAPGEQRALTGNPVSFTEEETTYKAAIDWTPDLEMTDSTLIYASISSHNMVEFLTYYSRMCICNDAACHVLEFCTYSKNGSFGQYELHSFDF